MTHSGGLSSVKIPVDKEVLGNVFNFEEEAEEFQGICREYGGARKWKRIPDKNLQPGGSVPVESAKEAV